MQQLVLYELLNTHRPQECYITVESRHEVVITLGCLLTQEWPQCSHSACFNHNYCLKRGGKKTIPKKLAHLSFDDHVRSVNLVGIRQTSRFAFKLNFWMICIMFRQIIIRVYLITGCMSLWTHLLKCIPNQPTMNYSFLFYIFIRNR